MIYAGTRPTIDAYLGTKKVLMACLGEATLYVARMVVDCTFDEVTSDAPEAVEYGSSLSVTLSATSGNKVQENSVEVTMGGVDITSTSYDHSTKTITIASVTGNVSITAVGRPYDAEVEYLQTDGTAYINTGIKVASTTTFDISMHIPAGLARLFGGRVSSTSSQMMMNKDTSSSQKHYRWFYGGSSYNGPSVTDSTPAEDHTFNNTENSRVCVMDGTTSITASTKTFSTSVDFVIFGYNLNGTYSEGANGTRCKYAKMYSSGTLVRDYIPVKDNGVGYLYDKVSKQLFGNANSSGAFSYGNDV